jgi:serine/threonine protein kinase
VLRESGKGTFGKVLLCEDVDSRETFAIKVVRRIRKYTDAAAIEAAILADVNDADPSGASLCVRFFHSFDHGGHYCLVFEPLGMSLYDYVVANGHRPCPLYCVQAFSDQLVTAIAFLHELRLVHTDLKLENVLLRSSAPLLRTEKPSSTRAPMRLLAPPTTDVRREWQRWRVGMVAIGAAHSAADARLRASPSPAAAALSCTPHCQVIDFGGATYDWEYKSSIINTRQYRAPEVILGLGWSTPSDVWSLGCILMELYTGELLFKTVRAHPVTAAAVCRAGVCRTRVASSMASCLVSPSQRRPCPLTRPRRARERSTTTRSTWR